MRTVDLEPEDEEVDSTFTVVEEDAAVDRDDEVAVTTVTEEEEP